MYSHGIARFYDLFAEGASAAPEQAGFISRYAHAGATILDIGAGTGNLAFSLAGAGHHVTALEPDPEMYTAMLARLALRNDLQTNLTPLPKPLGFDLQQRFELCLSLAVMHLLDPAQREALFACARQHLRDTGVLILEAPVESPARMELPRQLKAERTFGATRYQHYYAMRRTAQQRWCTTWEFLTWRGEELLDRRTREFDWKASSKAEIVALAEGAGLEVGEMFGGFDRAAFVDGESRVLVAVAARRA
jgi:SAM-dependent methyltransferase